MMTFREAGLVCWRKKFTFSGRATRAEYWWWTLWVFLVTLVVVPVCVVVAVVLLELGGILSLLLLVPMAVAILAFLVVALVAGVAVAIRRLHDRTLSAWWWVFLSLVPGAVGLAWYDRPWTGWGLLLTLAIWACSLALFVITVLPSHGDNKYGPAWTAAGSDPADTW